MSQLVRRAMNPPRYVVTVAGDGIVWEGQSRARADSWFETYCQEPRNTVRLHDTASGAVVRVRKEKEKP